MSDGQHSYYEFWKETVSRIKQTLPEQEYNTWFNRLTYLRSEKGKVILGGASQFILDTVVSRYRELLVNTLSELTGEELTVQFEVASRDELEQGPEIDQEEREVSSRKSEAKRAISAQKNAKNRAESNLNPSYDFSSFVIGDNSAFAYNASLAIAKNPGSSYNPCLIYGGVGLGKTHLLSSIGNYIQIGRASCRERV